MKIIVVVLIVLAVAACGACPTSSTDVVDVHALDPAPADPAPADPAPADPAPADPAPGDPKGRPRMEGPPEGASASRESAAARVAARESRPDGRPHFTSPYRRDADGWTVLEPVTSGNATTRKIFVSSSEGDDAHDGLSPEKPKKTIRAGLDLLRHGYPDWLLLRRGDAWEETLWVNHLSGAAPGKPLVITAYGEGPRPLIQSGIHSGIGFHPDERHEHIAVVGLAFQAHLRDPGHPRFNPTVEYFDENQGVSATTQGKDLLVEDCTFRHYGVGVVVQDVRGGTFEGFELRRSAIFDIWTAGKSFSQGIYLYKVDGILLEENLVDVAGHSPRAGKKGTIFDHSVYIQNGCTGERTVLRGNLFARGDGIQMREGGLAVDNLFFRTWIALHCGGGNESNPKGVVCVLEDNVILEGEDINEQDHRGWGLYLTNLRAPSHVKGTLIAHNKRGRFPQPFQVNGAKKDDRGIPQIVRSLVVDDTIIYRWGGGVLLQGGPTEIQKLSLANTSIESTSKDPLITHIPAAQLAKVKAQRTLLYSPAGEDEVIATDEGRLDLEEWQERTADPKARFVRVRYPDPERDLDRYAKEVLGLGGAEALLEKARTLPHDETGAKLRAAAINRYLRAGFGRND